MPEMRAKLKLFHVERHSETQETLRFHAVAKNEAYGADGKDEDNTFAKFTPSASLDMMVMNPDLVGHFKAGDTFYVDFTKAD
ncbi:hypothetical protein MKK88_20525 [Methylobacterium sp. E-005]|uniref:hypothetical protein n=1 Tax=Methylobacterium sp. E-005 TaxID=2836549 RepID=UPI001FBAD786|nr:hypothetical protein [Methylobacterium sp. E-005]MCJ2088352.1 hypothetical protein [Methylobacterium sp. E-005]